MAETLPQTDKEPSPTRDAWVYIVQCADNTLYTGWCYNINRRLAAHNRGKGARYTRGRRPVSLRWCEPQPSRSAAMRREAEIKRLNRAAKERLIRLAGSEEPQEDL